MSRIGLQVIELPESVELKQEGQTVSAKGPKGELSVEISPLIKMTIDGQEVSFERENNTKEARSLHGTTRSLVANMVTGVTEGFEKRLELVGVGYRAQAQGDKKLNLNVGLSHPVDFEAGEDITIETPDANHIIIRGTNKEAVGQLAADIRAVRPPEPYKGKGIKYEGEHIIRKEGKTGK